MNYRFNENWTIHNRFLASFIHGDSTFLSPAPAFEEALQDDHRTFGRSPFSQAVDTETYTTNLDLTGKFEVAGIQHNALVGFDYLRSYTQYQIHGDFDNPTPGLELDIFNPVYGIDPAVFDIPKISVGYNFPTYLDEWYGIYFQDHITLWDTLHITGGGRHDWARTGNEWNESFAASDANRVMHRNDGFSPRVGIVTSLLTNLASMVTGQPLLERTMAFQQQARILILKLQNNMR